MEIRIFQYIVWEVYSVDNVLNPKKTTTTWKSTVVLHLPQTEATG